MHGGNQPSRSLIAAPVDIVANDVAARTEDLATDKALPFVSMSADRRRVDRIRRHSGRAAIIQLDHGEPRVGVHQIASRVPGDMFDAGALPPVDYVGAGGELEIVRNLVTL